MRLATHRHAAQTTMVWAVIMASALGPLLQAGSNPPPPLPAFQPLSSPTPPKPKDAAWARQPIDHFIRARLEVAGLSPAPEADRVTWLRRVSLT